MANSLKRIRFTAFFGTKGKFLPWNSPPKTGAGSDGAFGFVIPYYKYFTPLGLKTQAS
jgi:hypothetical protein